MRKSNFFRRIFPMLPALLLFAAMLGGCGQTETVQPDIPVEDVDEEALIEEMPQEEEEAANVRDPELVDWDSEKSIVETAKENNTMIIQFMSGEGLYISGNSGNTDKWGDAVLLVFPDGETMLIDGGMPDYGKFLVENLQKLGVERLDYCMLSHMHNDHWGGFLSAGGLFDSIEIGTYLWSGIYPYKYSDSMKVQLERTAEFKNMKTATLARGDEMLFGDVKMTVLSPEPGNVGGTSANDTDESVNADSIAVRFDYGECSYMTAGDFYMTTEKELMSRIDVSLLEVDIAKIDHHGRPTSSDTDWCAAQKAKIAVATGSTDMAVTTYNAYAKVGTVCYGDRYDGYIRVEMKADGSFTVHTSRERTVDTFDALDEKYHIERKTAY